MLGATLAWFILACIALNRFRDTDVHAVCAGSSLWAALLTWVVIVGVSLFGGGSAAKSKDEKDNCVRICAAVTSLVVWAGLNVWLGVELFDGCVQANIVHTNLYKMSYIWFIAVWCMIGLVLLIAILFGCTLCVATLTEVPEPLRTGGVASAETAYSPPAPYDLEAQTNSNTASNAVASRWLTPPTFTGTKSGFAPPTSAGTKSGFAPPTSAGVKKGAAPPPSAVDFQVHPITAAQPARTTGVPAAYAGQ
jgi:hypothetical protein